MMYFMFVSFDFRLWMLLIVMWFVEGEEFGNKIYFKNDDYFRVIII